MYTLEVLALKRWHINRVIDLNTSKHRLKHPEVAAFLPFLPNRDIADKATEFVLLMYHSVYGVFRSGLKIYLAQRYK